MAVALDHNTNIEGTGGNGVSGAFTVNASGSLIVVELGGYFASGAYPTDVTYNGVSLTKLTEVALDANVRGQIWYKHNPSTGSNTLAVVSGNSYWGWVSVQEWTGHDTTTPLQDAITPGSGTGVTTLSDTVANVGANDYVIDCAIISADEAMTAGANQTAFQGLNGVGNSRQAGSAGGVMSWDWTTSGNYKHLACRIVAAAAGGGGNPWYYYANQFRREPLKKLWTLPDRWPLWTPKPVLARVV